MNVRIIIIIIIIHGWDNRVRPKKFRQKAKENDGNLINRTKLQIWSKKLGLIVSRQNPTVKDCQKQVGNIDNSMHAVSTNNRRISGKQLTS